MQIRRCLQDAAHFGAIKTPVRLRPRRLHGGPARTVQEPKLNPGPVDDAPHDSTEGIYLPDNMAFSDSADGRITGHLPDKIEIDRHYRCLAPETSRSRSR